MEFCSQLIHEGEVNFLRALRTEKVYEGEILAERSTQGCTWQDPKKRNEMQEAMMSRWPAFG